MIVPTITAFKQALSSPHTHFVMLKQIEPVLQNGQIIVNHTTLATECKVRLNGALYMMYMPFSYQTTQRIAELETKMHNIDSSIICHNKIYYNEVLVKRTTDKAFYCDIIMQQIPEGRSMVEAILLDNLLENLLRKELVRREVLVVSNTAVLHRLLREQDALHRVLVHKTLGAGELIKAVVRAWSIDIVLQLDGLTLVCADKC